MTEVVQNLTTISYSQHNKTDTGTFNTFVPGRRKTIAEPAAVRPHVSSVPRRA